MMWIYLLSVSMLPIIMYTNNQFTDTYQYKVTWDSLGIATFWLSAFVGVAIVVIPLYIYYKTSYLLGWRFRYQDKLRELLIEEEQNLKMA